MNNAPLLKKAARIAADGRAAKIWMQLGIRDHLPNKIKELQVFKLGFRVPSLYILGSSGQEYDGEAR